MPTCTVKNCRNLAEIVEFWSFGTLESEELLCLGHASDPLSNPNAYGVDEVSLRLTTEVAK